MFGYIMFLILVWVWYIYFKHPDYKICQFEDIKDKCKTGDIILFHGLDNAIPMFIGTYYSHIGIVYVDPDDETNTPYVFEAFNPSLMPIYPDNCKSGIVIADLKNRMENYRGYCFYKELANPLDNDTLRSYKEFVLYAKNHMYYDIDVASSAIGKFLFNDPIRRGVNCGELVYLSLIKLNLLDMDCFYENNKHHLLFLVKLVDVNNNYYKEPVFVLTNYYKKNIY